VGIDEEAPQTTITEIIGTMGENNWYIGNVGIFLTATDGLLGTGVNKTYYKIDEGEPQEYDDVTGIELPPDNPNTLSGTWDVYYWSDDKAGNIEPMNGPEQIKIDKANPHIEITEPPDRGIVYGDFIVKAEASDEGSGIKHVLFDTGPPYDDPIIVEEEDPPGSGVYKWLCTRHHQLQWKHLIAVVYDYAGHSYESNIYVFFANPRSVSILNGILQHIKIDEDLQIETSEYAADADAVKLVTTKIIFRKQYTSWDYDLSDGCSAVFDVPTGFYKITAVSYKNDEEIASNMISRIIYIAR